MKSLCGSVHGFHNYGAKILQLASYHLQYKSFLYTYKIDVATYFPRKVYKPYKYYMGQSHLNPLQMVMYARSGARIVNKLENDVYLVTHVSTGMDFVQLIIEDKLESFTIFYVIISWLLEYLVFVTIQGLL